MTGKSGRLPASERRGGPACALLRLWCCWSRSRRWWRPSPGGCGFRPSLLVVVGLVVGMLPRAPAIDVPPDVVSLVVLPPLLYVASEELAWRDLRAVWRPVAVLAVGLVLASAAAVAAVGVAVASLSASMAFVLGAVLASTDPVAVSALARRLSLPVRVQTLVQAESCSTTAPAWCCTRSPSPWRSVARPGWPRRASAARGGRVRRARGRGRTGRCRGRGRCHRGAPRITDPVLETVRLWSPRMRPICSARRSMSRA